MLAPPVSISVANQIESPFIDRQREVEESACDWINYKEGTAQGAALQLPPFPEFTKEFELPMVIPIPRLLPSYQWVQSLQRGDAPRQAATLSIPAALGAGLLGVAMGAGLTLAGAGAVYLIRGVARRRAGRPQLRHQPELVKRASRCPD